MNVYKSKISFAILPKISIYFLILLNFSSCSSTKYVGENELLLVSNTIVYKSNSLDSSSYSFTTDDILGVIKQQPNRKTFKIPFYLTIYNLSNQKRIDRRIVAKKRKLEKRTNKKVEKHSEKAKKYAEKLDAEQAENSTSKKAKKYQKKIKKFANKIDLDTQRTIKRTFGEVLRDIGEAPVILDSNSISKTVSQLSILLVNRGYFNNIVTDSIVTNKNYKLTTTPNKKYNKATVYYNITPNQPYVVNYYDNDVKDTTIKKLISKLKDSKVEVGQNFNTDYLDGERKIITQLLLENGYYHFNKEFIFFKIDSSCGQKKMDITLSIQNFKYKDIGKDSILERQHIQYKVTNIDYYIGFSPKDTSNSKSPKLTYVSLSLLQRFQCLYHHSLHQQVKI